MNKYKTIALLSAISICLALGSCKGNESQADSPDIPIPPPNSQTDTNMNYNYNTDVSAYLSAIISKNLFLVNKQNPCGESYVPANLKKLPEAIAIKDIELDATAASALEAMMQEMRAAGINDVFVTSAYRSFEYQTYLYNSYCEAERAQNPNLSDSEIKQKVLTYSAYPGTSEHQSGLCVDLMSTKMTKLVNYGRETDTEGDLGFAETEAYTWLMQNAYKFGFIIRYPQNKTALTGYSYESWHYRFVGREAASSIYAQGITLEEYLKQIQ